MGSTTRRAGAEINVHQARDQLNLLATYDNRALQNLRAQHALKPLPALEAYRQAVALLDEPHALRSTGSRAYWPTLEGEEMRSRPLSAGVSPKKKKRRLGHLPRAD